MSTTEGEETSGFVTKAAVLIAVHTALQSDIAVVEVVAAVQPVVAHT